MDAAQALADLTEISSQIEAAVLADSEGGLVASTLADEERGKELAASALELLRSADESGRDGLVQLEAATQGGSVFVVRGGDHVVAAVTAAQPTVGLVFYDLKTCLRLVGQDDEPAKEPRSPGTEDDDGEA